MHARNMNVGMYVCRFDLQLRSLRRVGFLPRSSRNVPDVSDFFREARGKFPTRRISSAKLAEGFRRVGFPRWRGLVARAVLQDPGRHGLQVRASEKNLNLKNVSRM
jgi:hypothetical protein